VAARAVLVAVSLAGVSVAVGAPLVPGCRLVAGRRADPDLAGAADARADRSIGAGDAELLDAVRAATRRAGPREADRLSGNSAD
jgi:hypothetical protein